MYKGDHLPRVHSWQEWDLNPSTFRAHGLHSAPACLLHPHLLASAQLGRSRRADPHSVKDTGLQPPPCLPRPLAAPAPVYLVTLFSCTTPCHGPARSPIPRSPFERVIGGWNEGLRLRDGQTDSQPGGRQGHSQVTQTTRQA